MQRFFLLLIFIFSAGLYAQHTGMEYTTFATDKSVHDSLPPSFIQQELAYYGAQSIPAEAYYQVNQPALKERTDRSACNLNRMVFGWHPYWQNGLEANYDWDLISDFCYFSYEVDANTGNATSTHSFATINAVDTALARGLKVHLCVTLFSGHATFFGSATSRNTLIQNLITVVTNRGAHGINIDFEGVPAAQATNFNNFMVALADSVHAHDPAMKVSMCLYSVDWNNIFNEPLLKDHVDFFTVMGYDYYYSGSSTAGPCDPLYGFSTGYDYSLSRSVTYYRNAGIPQDQLVLGIPYYGKEWETTSNAIPSATTGNFTYSRTFKFIKDNTSGLYNSPIYNQRSVAKTYVFQNAGTWRQSWIDEQYELEERYDFVNQRDLLGIGIWALGYDDGYTELWQAIENKLTDCQVIACTDTIYDGGGPEMNYYDNENYTYTISPDLAAYVTLNFQSFTTEAGYDTLFIYDGPTTGSPLIGAYTGSASPGTVVSSGPSLTLRFKSDGATRAPGWMAVWTCTQDNSPPTTAIQDPGNWITQDAAIDFTDADNMNVLYTFWNVADLNAAGHWHSNITEGFCTDDFDELLSEWTVETGTWNLNSGTILQTDEALTNTNMYINVNQNNFDQYYYSWRARTGGTGTNRRSGFHFMCDNPTLPNRGNSYFVWFRPDQAQLQFYEVTSDVFSLMHTVPLTTTPNIWYNYAVIYNQLTGRMDVYVNGTQVGYWQDPTPLTVGNAVSFRSGNATLEVDHIEIYRNRLANETLTAGTLSSMFRYENPSPYIPAGKISSVAVDEAYLLGFDSLYQDVDFTPPVYTVLPTDEQTDVDTLINQTSFLAYANIFTDPNSGLNTVEYGVGTAPGQNDVMGLNPLPVGDSVVINTASLINGQYYYVNVMATNQAGLISDTVSSDGFLFIQNAGIENNPANFRMYPNPTSSYVCVEVNKEVNLELVDAHGKVVVARNIPAGISWVDVHELAVGYYFLSLGDKKYKLCIAR
jgi:spore germination protein YaaH